MVIRKPESLFEDKLMRRLEKIPKSHWFKFHSKVIRGLPDRVGCVRGHFVALEVKPSKLESMKKAGRLLLQRRILSYIRRAGGYAEIVYPENEDHVVEMIEKLGT